MFRRFLYFSKSDRRAISTLIVMAMTAIAIAVYVDNTKENDESPDEYGKNKATGAKEKTNSSDVSSTGKTVALNGGNKPVNLPDFDPNTVDSATLALFGIKDWKIRNLIKYRKAGGIFREPDAISRLYGWTKEEIERVLPHIYISEKYKTVQYGRTGNSTDENGTIAKFYKGQNKEKSDEYEKTYEIPRNEKFQKDTVIDANTADIETLKKIPGIGKGISNAIIEYRHKLGGYYNTEQLLEIKIFSPELLRWFYADQTKINRININNASFQALNAHPYISYEQTKSILNYKRLYGGFRNIEHLKSSNIFTDKEMERLKHYIEF